MSIKFDWQRAYKAAILERDKSKMIAKAKLAEEAMLARLWALPIAAQDEKIAIRKAIATLETLQEELDSTVNPK